MSDRSLPQRARHVVSWSQARPGATSMCAGAVLGVSTVVFSAINAISAQQAVAMAVPAIVAITGGLVRMLVLDSWAAWRRGFEHGCRAALAYRLPGASADDSGAADLDGEAAPARLVPRLASPRCPPGAAS